MAAAALIPAALAGGRQPSVAHISIAASGKADGGSVRPSISPDGRFVAFDSTATTLAPDGNGDVRDVFLRDGLLNRTELVSRAVDSPAGDGPSRDASVSAEGVVAFASAAANLVPGDTNGVADIFVRTRDGQIRRVSVGLGGLQANGESGDPDISSDGGRVVFSSAASNLASDDANEQEDVFVHDLGRGETMLVSGRDGATLSGRSRAPAISPDGGHVSFYSTSLLSPGARSDIGHVYLADLRAIEDLEEHPLRIASRSSRGRLQNRSVQPPFPQFSDVSEGGRHVVFDSDATNLVPRDRNGDSDVFVRDMRRGRTARASAATNGREGGNDSVHPVITGNGRYVTFQSFAERLVAGDRPGADIFLRDLRRRRTTLVTRGLGRELVDQLLQRPAVSDNGLRVAFTTTARGLARSDQNPHADVFLLRR